MNKVKSAAEALTGTIKPSVDWMDELNPLDVSSWDCCDEHETTFLRDSYCKECRIDKLETSLEALRPYLIHEFECQCYPDSTYAPCTCGLEALLNRRNEDE